MTAEQAFAPDKLLGELISEAAHQRTNYLLAGRMVLTTGIVKAFHLDQKLQEIEVELFSNGVSSASAVVSIHMVVSADPDVYVFPNGCDLDQEGKLCAGWHEARTEQLGNMYPSQKKYYIVQRLEYFNALAVIGQCGLLNIGQLNGNLTFNEAFPTQAAKHVSFSIKREEALTQEFTLDTFVPSQYKYRS